MKNKLTIISILLFIIVSLNYLLVETPPILLEERASEVKSYAYPIRSIDIRDTNYADLSFLSTVLNNNKVIFLGEQLHSDGSTFEAKARITRYLHEKLGYDVLLYEAGLYDMWLMNDQFYNKKYAVDYKEEQIPSIGLYSFWWDNNENKKLWNYFRENKNSKSPITFGGFDIQLTGTVDKKFRYTVLKTYLDKKNISLEKYKALSQNDGNIFDYFFYYQQLRPSFKDSLLIELGVIDSLLMKDKSNYEDDIYIRYLNGLKLRYESMWKYSSGSPQSMQTRDSLMADNLIWLIDSVYQERKIIVWTANVHTLYENPIKENQFNSVGEYVKRKYKDQAYMMTFTSFGRKTENSNQLSGKPNNKSIEYIFHQTQLPYFYIDMSNIPENSFLKQQNISVINQGLNLESNWSNATDGIFYIDTMNPIK